VKVELELEKQTPRSKVVETSGTRTGVSARTRRLEEEGVKQVLDADLLAEATGQRAERTLDRDLPQRERHFDLRRQLDRCVSNA